MNEKITKNEVENNGRTIHLYYNPEVGFWTAYGFSAFFATHIITGKTSYSEEYQMPVVLMNRDDVNELKLSTTKLQHEQHQYYELRMRNEIALDGYQRWLERIER